jgi:hypothetical protein
MIKVDIKIKYDKCLGIEGVRIVFDVAGLNSIFFYLLMWDLNSCPIPPLTRRLSQNDCALMRPGLSKGEFLLPQNYIYVLISTT